MTAARPLEDDIPADMADWSKTYRDKLMDEVAQNDDDVMEKYLEGEEITNEELYSRPQGGRGRRHRISHRRRLRHQTDRRDLLLDLLVDAIPSPAKHGSVKAIDASAGEIELECKADGPLAAFVFKTLADPFSGRINVMRVFSGELKSDSNVYQSRPARPRSTSASSCVCRARTTAPSMFSAPATSAPSPSSRRPIPAILFATNHSR